MDRQPHIVEPRFPRVIGHIAANRFDIVVSTRCTNVAWALNVLPLFQYCMACCDLMDPSQGVNLCVI
jgi:hypothetical protein